MKTGKKPSIIVIREFRGTRLYLVKVTRAPKGYRWTSDRSKALRLDYDTAATYVYQASREYGAQCAAIDSDGTVTATPGYESPSAKLLQGVMRDVAKRNPDAPVFVNKDRLYQQQNVEVDPITGIAHVYNGARKVVQS